MFFSPITTTNTRSLISSHVQSPSFNSKRNLPTPPPSLADVNDSSSCSSSSSSSFSTIASAYSANTTTSNTTLADTNHTVTTCDLLNIITDPRFRPIFQAIEEIKRHKCRPDFERILKYMGKRSATSISSCQRDEILLIIDDLLKIGLVTKVFHKGGFTIRVTNEKYARVIEKMNICLNEKTPTAKPMSPEEAMAAAVAAGTIHRTDHQWSVSNHSILNSTEINSHEQYRSREPLSPEFNARKHESSPMCPPVELDSNICRTSAMKDSTLISTPPTSTEKKKLGKKRNSSPTGSLSNVTKKARAKKSLESALLPSMSVPPLSDKHDDYLFRKPLMNYNSLPPITIEQLLGLRGDIPDVHNWSTHQLSAFFYQQGFEYASALFYQHHINGNEFYRLKREQVFRMSSLKIGQALKLWNAIEQIQRHQTSSFSSS